MTSPDRPAEARTQKPRRRAPAMEPEERRQMIVAAALPLVAEAGAKVTTGQIARAAGIAEGTIFRVYADKDELLDAVMAEAMRHDHAVREISSVSLDQPLAQRLSEAADALGAHLDRMGAVAGVLHASGHGHRRVRDEEGRRPRAGAREASMAAIRDALAELFAPEAELLRVSGDQAAALFLGLLFHRPQQLEAVALGTADLVTVFLHGALADGGADDR
ncbi:TetR/AcrR family transcriptional regulator [Streptomyces sp. NPDC101225]|uniref:TetR/AcrR family transcriptional regulator n=1 Tax=Streptomyces sp. NPDC101225 TaxID=3366135 RepID=UPI0037FDF8C6